MQVPNHAGYGPRCKGPQRPTKTTLSKIPSSRLRPARGCMPPSSGLRPVRGGALPPSGLCPDRGSAPPRADSASLEGPPRPRSEPASLEGALARMLLPPYTGHYRPDTGVAAPSCARGSRPGAATPTPQEGAHSHHCGKGLCGAAGVSPVTPCACASTANAPSPLKGAGFTLDLLSCDPTGLGGGARPEEHHPCHCYGMAAAPVRAGAHAAL
jgi:hypothetical protein